MGVGKWLRGGPHVSILVKSIKPVLNQSAHVSHFLLSFFSFEILPLQFRIYITANQRNLFFSFLFYITLNFKVQNPFFFFLHKV